MRARTRVDRLARRLRADRCPVCRDWPPILLGSAPDGWQGGEPFTPLWPETRRVCPACGRGRELRLLIGVDLDLV